MCFRGRLQHSPGIVFGQVFGPIQIWETFWSDLPCLELHRGIGLERNEGDFFLVDHLLVNSSIHEHNHLPPQPNALLAVGAEGEGAKPCRRV